MHRRLLALGALALAASLAAITGCNASAKNGSSDSGPNYILVTPNPIGNNSFLQLAQTGIKQAAKANGGSSKVYQSTDPASISQNVTSAVRAKPKVLVTVGFNFADVVQQQAQQHPKQQFLFVDGCIKKPLPNVTCATFREYEPTYLAGVESGMLTKSNKVGAVVVLDTPQFHRFSDPFAAGAKSVNPKISFTQLFVGGQNPFNDPARAKQQANALGAKGVDFIMGAASAAGNIGIFQAAKAGGFKAFGVDANQCPSAPGAVMDNVIKRTDVVITDGIKRIAQGQAGKVQSYGLKEGGMSLTGLQPDVASSQCEIAKHPEVIAKVKAVQAGIVSGKVKVADPEHQ